MHLKQLEGQSDSQQAQILALQRQAASLQESNTALQTHNANLQVLFLQRGSKHKQKLYFCLSQGKILSMQAKSNMCANIFLNYETNVECHSRNPFQPK